MRGRVHPPVTIEEAAVLNGSSVEHIQQLVETYKLPIDKYGRLPANCLTHVAMRIIEDVNVVQVSVTDEYSTQSHSGSC